MVFLGRRTGKMRRARAKCGPDLAHGRFRRQTTAARSQELADGAGSRELLGLEDERRRPRIEGTGGVLGSLGREAHWAAQDTQSEAEERAAKEAGGGGEQRPESLRPGEAGGPEDSHGRTEHRSGRRRGKGPTMTLEASRLLKAPLNGAVPMDDVDGTHLQRRARNVKQGLQSGLWVVEQAKDHGLHRQLPSLKGASGIAERSPSLVSNAQRHSMRWREEIAVRLDQHEAHDIVTRREGRGVQNF